ncbi:MAG TPA: autotransporter outer membrane beta-barrel domain-containing protein [Caulobacteraceae bacterium]|nr:autotransporter outer membrane beta-barrel domain-containing protein [Caulobacteraceae bacterium]
MKRALVTAVAVAPLMAALAGAAYGACPAAGTATNGANLEVASGCTVTPTATKPGLILNSSNNIVVDSGATISAVDVSGAVGIQALGGNTGSVTQSGAISLTMSYKPVTNAQTGIADGAFATGTGRIGIEVVTGDGADGGLVNGALNGAVTTAVSSALTIQGNQSYAISIDAAPAGSAAADSGITGNLVSDGAISMLGDGSAGIRIAAPVGGSVTIAGAISATGVGAQGLITSAPITGQLAIGNSITVSGYRSTVAPTTPVILADLTKTQLEQGGSAVVVGGNVGGGIDVAPAVTTGSGTGAVTSAAGTLAVFGSAPALQIGTEAGAITIGDNASDPFGLVVGGTVTASGVYSQKTSPNLAAPAPATAVLIGAGPAAAAKTSDGVAYEELGAGGPGVALTGGVHVVGTVTATALDAQATAMEIGRGVTGTAIVNDGEIAAGVTASEAQPVFGILIDKGADIASIANTGLISAATTANAAFDGFNGAIIDQSGMVTSISNTGQIAASITPSANTFAAGGPTIAIDESAGTAGLALTQTPSVTWRGLPAPQFTGAIAGTTLSVTAAPGKGQAAIAVGQTLYGPGVAAGTTILAEVTGTGGVGTYTVSTSQTVKSEAVSAAGPAPVISGDILLGAGANSMDIEAGSTLGAVTELGGQRDFRLDVAATPGASASVDITRAETHQVTSLAVGAGGVLTAAVDPTFALGASNPTPIFDATVHAGQSGPDGTATFANGAQVGISLDTLQANPIATYVFVHTSGPGQLSVGSLGQTLLANAPFLYDATAQVSASGADLDVTVTRKTAAQLGFNASESAALNAIFADLQRPGSQAIAGALVAQTTRAGLFNLYDQLLPDQGIGIFDTLEGVTEKISDLTAQTPDGGARIGGTSLWLQEVNERVARTTAATLGENDRALGLVGGYEKMGLGGGAVGLTLSYLNIEDNGAAAAIGSHVVTNLVEAGAYYRRAWGGLRLSLRGAGGYAWFNQKRLFVATDVNEISYGAWNGVFADGHAGAAWQAHFGRFYLRPELDADYLYLDEAAHSDTGAAPGLNIAIAQRTSARATGSGILNFGAQFGHEVWFRPEIFAGYREVFGGGIGNTVATFDGGSPFTLAPGDSRGGWITAGFALKGGTPLSYVAIEGDADFRSNEQRFDLYLAGRAMF